MITKSTTDTTNIMNSYSFPPADDLISVLKKINYQKLWYQFVTIILYTVAIVHVLYSRYQNGGKESLQWLYEIPILCIDWIRYSAYPTLKNIT